MSNIFTRSLYGVFFVNNRQVVSFTSITLNVSLAHEFGHAFGLGHAFSDENKTGKKNEKKTVEETKFYKEVSSLLENLKKWFAPKQDGKKYQFEKKENQKKVVTSLGLYLQSWEGKAKEEKTLDNTGEILQVSFDNKLQKSDTKENFMDYIDDYSRKSFTINQLQIIGK